MKPLLAGQYATEPEQQYPVAEQVALAELTALVWDPVWDPAKNMVNYLNCLQLLLAGAVVVADDAELGKAAVEVVVVEELAIGSDAVGVGDGGEGEAASAKGSSAHAELAKGYFDISLAVLVDHIAKDIVDCIALHLALHQAPVLGQVQLDVLLWEPVLSFGSVLVVLSPLVVLVPVGFALDCVGDGVRVVLRQLLGYAVYPHSIDAEAAAAVPPVCVAPDIVQVLVQLPGGDDVPVVVG